MTAYVENLFSCVYGQWYIFICEPLFKKVFFLVSLFLLNYIFIMNFQEFLSYF